LFLVPQDANSEFILTKTGQITVALTLFIGCIL